VPRNTALDKTFAVSVADGALDVAFTTVADNAKLSALEVVASTAPPPTPTTGFGAMINFQPASAPIPAGYLKDDGATYGPRGNGYTYGWSVNNTANTRDRNSTRSPDQRYDTLNHMQLGGTFAWEVAVPNGTYRVRVVAGDPSHIDSVYRLSVEGVLAVDGTPTSANRWLEGTVSVTVGDGRLTVSNAPGSKNNKICFVEITSV
ncbi:MAG: hypothetical protein HY332_13410, partial [Chloroflexi bacterium]|nr:hypothetical protein [Chloroflexota bacterium]